MLTVITRRKEGEGGKRERGEGGERETERERQRQREREIPRMQMISNTMSRNDGKSTHYTVIILID